MSANLDSKAALQMFVIHLKVTFIMHQLPYTCMMAPSTSLVLRGRYATQHQQPGCKRFSQRVELMHKMAAPRMKQICVF